MSFLPSPIPHPLAWWHDAPGWVLEGLNWVVGVQWPAGNEKLTWDLADTWYGAGKDLTPAIDAFTQGGPDASLGFGGLASDIGTQIDAIWRAYANDPETGLRYLQTVLHEIGQLVDGTACDIESAKIEMYVEIGFMIVELIMLAAAAFATFGTAAAAEPAAMAAGRFAISRIFKQLLKKVVERAAKKAAKEALEAAAKKVSKEGLKRLLKDAGKHALREGAEEVATEFAVESSQMARGHRDGGFDLLALGFSALGGGVGGAFGGLAGLGPNVKNKAGHFFESLGRGAAGEMIAETGANLATGQGLPSLANLGMAGTSGMRSGLTDHVTEGLNDRTHDKLLDIGAHLDATSAAVSAPSDAMAALAQPTRDPGVTGPPGGTTATGTTFTDAAYPGDGVHNGAPGQTVASGADDTVSNGQSGYVTTVSTHTGGGSTDLAGLATTSSPATVGGSGVDTVPASTHTASPGGVTGGGTVAVAPTGVAPTGLAPTGLAQTTAPTGLAPATAPTGFTPTTAPAGLTATTAPTGPASTTAPTGPASTTAPTGPAQAPVSSPGTSMAPGHTGAPPAVAPSQPTGASAVPGSPHGTTAAPVLVPGGTPTGGEPPGTASHHTPAQSRTDATASRLDAARRREALAQQHRDQNLRERDQQYQTAQRKLDDSLQRWMDARQRHDPTADRIADQEVVPARQARDEAAARLVQAIFDPASAGVHTLDSHEFASINTDEGRVVLGGLDTGAASARPGDLTPPVEESRGYGEPGGHRMPLEYDQAMVERYFPRDEHGQPVRFPDPDEVWFQLTNDGGPDADPTRGINCTDCVLSLFDSWMHGRPRVAAPRTFDAYADGDPTRPLHGQPSGIARIEDALGTTFTPTFDHATSGSPSLDQSVADLRQTVQTAGHGAFAAIVVTTADGRTHVFAAVNYHGEVRFLDAQRSYRSTTFPVDTAGVTRMSVAVVDADTRSVHVAPASPALATGHIHTDITVDPTADPRDMPQTRPSHVMPSHDVPTQPSPTQPSPTQPSPPPPAAPPHPRDLGGVRFDTQAEEQRILASLDPSDRAAIEASLRAAEPIAQGVQAKLEHMLGTLDGAGDPGAAHLVDTQTRVKGAGSIARALAAHLAEPRADVHALLAGLNDRVRFRVLTPEIGYAATIAGLTERLRAAGYTVKAPKNFWLEGNRFYGVNMNVVTPEGHLLEIQFPTAVTQAVGERTHVPYEVVRLLDADPVLRVKAFLQILAANRDLGIVDHMPDGLGSLPPPKDTSFGAWVQQNPTVWSYYRALIGGRLDAFVGVVTHFGLTLDDFPGVERLRLTDDGRVRLPGAVSAEPTGPDLHGLRMAEPDREPAGGRDVARQAPPVDLRGADPGAGDLRRPEPGAVGTGGPGDRGGHLPADPGDGAAERGGARPDLPGEEPVLGRSATDDLGPAGLADLALPVARTVPAPVFGFADFFADDGWQHRAAEFERNLGAYLFNQDEVHRAASRAVDQLRDTLHRLAAIAHPDKSPAQIEPLVEAAFFKDDGSSAGQVDPSIGLQTLIDEGNVREQMTAFFNAAYNSENEYGLARMLLALKDSGRLAEAAAAGVDVGVLATLGHQLDAPPPPSLSPTAAARAFYRDFFSVGPAVMGLTSRGEPNITEFIDSRTGRVDRSGVDLESRVSTPADYERLGIDLSPRELAFQARHLGHAVDDTTPLAIREGAVLHDLQGDWAAAMRRLGFPVQDGISGTTSRMLVAARLLGTQPDQAGAFLGALMGWMLPGPDHSLLEVLRAADAVGVGRLDPATAGSLNPVDLYRWMPVDKHDLREFLADRGLSRDGLFPHEEAYLVRAGADPAHPHPRQFTATDTELRAFAAERAAMLRGDLPAHPVLEHWLERSGYDPHDPATWQALADQLTEAHVAALAVYSQSTYPLIHITLRAAMTPGSPDPGPELWNRLWGITGQYLDALSQGQPWTVEAPNALTGLLHTGPPSTVDLQLTPLGAAWVDANQRHTAALAARDDAALITADRDMAAARQQLEDQLRARLPRLQEELRWHADMVYDALMALPVVGSPTRPVIAYRGDELNDPIKQVLYGTDGPGGNPRGEARQVLSVTRDLDTAIRFLWRDLAKGGLRREDVGVVVYLLTGVGGRDIAPFSMYPNESEIVLPPGSTTARDAAPDKAIVSVVENHPGFPSGAKIIVVREARPHGA